MLLLIPLKYQLEVRCGDTPCLSSQQMLDGGRRIRIQSHLQQVQDQPKLHENMSQTSSKQSGQ